MATQIQMRRGTAAAWTSADPVLAEGEIGVETDTKKMKLGDGSTAWTSLGYMDVPAAAHAIGGAEHTASTLAQLNALISDATLIDTGDARLSDARTPTSHAIAGAEHSSSTLAQLNAKVSDATLIDTGDARLSDSRTCNNTFDNAATARTNLDVYSTSEVDGKVVGLYDHKGAYDAATNTPDLDTSPSGIEKGDAYTVSVAGNFFAEAVEVGDVLIADQDDPTLLSHWTRVNKNISFGTTAGTACEGDDARLSDARTPTSHASTHQHGGSDEVATATPAANAIPKANGSGDLDNGWISQSSVTQHQAAIDHDSLANFVANEHIDWTTDQGATNIHQSNLSYLKGDVLTGGSKPAHAEGNIFYDGDEHALAVHNDEADVTHQVGQEGFIRVYNNSGALIPNGKPVYVSGTEGVEFRPTIALAQSNDRATSQVIGFTTHDIENNTFGYVTYWGLVNDLDTSTFSAGDALYLREDVAGGLRTTPPPEGNFEILLGYVIRADVSAGRVLVALNLDLGLPAGDAEELVSLCLKGSAGTINPGDVVYISGWNVGQQLPEVELADASAAATMPAFGVARDSITSGAEGRIVVSGRLSGIDTSAFTSGDPLYVSETAGALTATKPTGTALIQRIGEVLRSNVSNGVIQVLGAGRTNDLPNLPTDNVWVGDGSGVPVATDRSGIDDVAIHDDTAGEIAALPLVTAAAGDHILIEDASDANNKKRVDASDLLGGGSGEPNTASNVGDGADVFKQKTGVDLEFRGIKAASTKISAVVNLDNIDLDVPDASTTAKGAVELATDGESAAGVVVQGNDARLSDARTPTAHASTHQHGGSDEVATATAAANAIPKADGTGQLSAAWVPDGGDGSAIHDDTAGEIAALTLVTAAAGDHVLIEDASDANNKKRVAASDFLGGGGSSITVEDEGTPLTTAVTKFNFAGAGVTVTEPVADEVLVTIPGGGGGADLAGAQARRTTNQSASATYTDIDFDTTDLENDTAKVDHDAVTDRIVVKETGLYKVGIQGVVRCSQAGDGARFRLRVNDTTVVAGSEVAVIAQTSYDQWTTSTSYAVNDIVSNIGALPEFDRRANYVCIQAHTSSATDKPGDGANWGTYWDVVHGINNTDIPFNREVLVSLNANDFLTWQIDDASQVSAASLQAGNFPAIFTVTSLVGQIGPQGPAGSNGADGDITWEGAWLTATAYTTNQAVEHNGSSYVCILNHTSSASDEPGVGGSWATYWELMAQKGADGAIGPTGPVNSLDLSFADGSNRWYQTNSTTYIKVADLIFRGTGSVGTPTAIKSIAGNDSGVTGQLRIFDVTNSQVIAESASYANTTKAIVSYGAISNLSSGEAIWEIQFKRVSGTGNSATRIMSLQVQF